MLGAGGNKASRYSIPKKDHSHSDTIPKFLNHTFKFSQQFQGIAVVLLFLFLSA